MNPEACLIARLTYPLNASSERVSFAENVGSQKAETTERIWEKTTLTGGKNSFF